MSNERDIRFHGYFDIIWTVRRHGNADLLRFRGSEPVVCSGLRGGLRDGLFVWFLAGRMAFWLSRGDLVDRGASTLA